MALFSPIAALPQAGNTLAAGLTGGPAQGDPNALSPSFSDSLQSAFSQVNTLQNHADGLARDFAAGRTSDVHSVMIAAEQATIALQLTTQIRNKAVDAYQEIMRISL